MALEADIELLEKKRLDIAILNDAVAALFSILNNPAGMEIVIKNAQGDSFSTASLKERLTANGADETAMGVTFDNALITAIGGTLTPNTLLGGTYATSNAYQAAIFAE